MSTDRANSIKFINDQYSKGSRELAPPPTLNQTDGFFSRNTINGGRESYSMSNQFGKPIGLPDANINFVKKTHSQIDVDSLEGMLFRNSRNNEEVDPVAANRISDYRIDPTAPKLDAPRQHFSLLRNTIETEPIKEMNIKKTASPVVVLPIAPPVPTIEINKKASVDSQNAPISVPIADRNFLGLPIGMWVVLLVLLFTLIATIFVAIKTKHEHDWLSRRGFLPVNPQALTTVQ